MPEIKEALQHHRAGRLQEAEALYRQILATTPDHAGALHQLGVLSAQMGDHEAAAGLIEQAVRVNPKVPDYHNDLGLALEAQGRLTEAIAAYRQALALAPTATEIYNNLGIALQAQGSLDDAATTFEQARALKPDLAETHYNLGNTRRAQGKLPEAITAYREAIKLRPDLVSAHNNLGSALKKQGELTEAIACYQQALKLKPDSAEAHNNLANALKAQGRLAEAVSAYQAALRCRPDYTNSYFNLANLFLDQAELLDESELQAAVECYRQVLRFSPENIEAWNGLGATLLRLQHLAEAREACHTALRIDPDHADAHNNLGLVHAALGDVEAAMTCYRKAVELDPDYAQAYENLAGLRRYGPEDSDEIAHLQSLVDSPKRSESAQTSLHFALGKMLDDCGRFDEAFVHYQDANRRNTSRFDAQESADLASRIIDTFDFEFLSHRARDGSSSELPVFVVGIPRSGKSLMERLMSRHPHVHDAGELNYFYRLRIELPERLKTSTPYPECISSIDGPTIQSLAESYIERLRQRSSEARRVVNTIPNFTNIGLIALLFPKARIVHVRRHPLDACLEIYFKHFAKKHFYSYDLEDIVAYYQEYQRLMAHWNRVLPDRILTVDYENLVHKETDSLRQLFNWCDLEWDEPDPSHTDDARAWNGQEQLSQQYIGRWKNYDKFIGPLKRGLGYL